MVNVSVAGCRIELFDQDTSQAYAALLAGEVVNADQGGAAASVNEIIAELPKVVPTAHVVSSRGCQCRRDHLHFTPAGYRELGKRYADVMRDLM